MRRSERFRLWVRRAVKSGQLFVEVEVRGNDAGDQSRTAIECQVLDGPLDKNQNPALERDQIHQVNKGPDQPRGQPGETKTEHIGHSSGAANHGKRSLVEIVKRTKVRPGVHFPQDGFCCVRSTLHGYLCQSGQGVAVRVSRGGQIANDIDIG